MGLYLCVFKGNQEIDGVEVGSYDDFDEFRENVKEFVEDGNWGLKCPTLMMHSDCDGFWDINDVKNLEQELVLIRDTFINVKQFVVESEWKNSVMKIIGLKPSNLYESFIDVDGEYLIDRLINLCKVAIRENESILFQ